MNKLLSTVAFVGATMLILPALAQSVGPTNVIGQWSGGLGSWFAGDNGGQYYVRTDDVDYSYEKTIIDRSYSHWLLGLPLQPIKFSAVPNSNQVTNVHTPWPGGQ